MKEAGLKAFSLRTENKSGIYSHEKEPVPLHQDFEKQFQKNKAAWNFSQPKLLLIKSNDTLDYECQAGKTQQSRLEKVIQESEQQKD